MSDVGSSSPVGTVSYGIGRAYRGQMFSSRIASDVLSGGLGQIVPIRFRIGDRLTVVARWTRVADQTRLWSARFERKLEDVFAVQKEIAVGIAEAIREELGIHDTAAFLFEYRYQTSNVRAWELFRKGFDLAFTFQPKRMAEGRELIQRALDHDPDYVAAKALLAWSDFDQPEERVKVAKEVLEHDPTNVTAYRILIDDSMTQFDFATAQRLWEYAAALKPQDNSLTLIGHRLFASIGDLRKTLEVARRGVRLDPMWNTQHYFLGMAYLHRGNPEAAIEPLLQAISLYPETGSKGIPLSEFLGALAMAYHLTGRDNDALQAAVSGHPAYQDALRCAWKTDGWAGMNLALATAFSAEKGPEWSRNIREYFAGVLYARAGARQEMYAFLEGLMKKTGCNRPRDRAAYRDSCMLCESINASIDFQPYRQELRFLRLKKALDARLAAKAGASKHSI